MMKQTEVQGDDTDQSNRLPTSKTTNKRFRSNSIMTYTSIAKPLTHYVDNPHAQALCQKYGLRLERIPQHDKFAILQLIGAIGSAYTDPRFDGEYNDESPYQCSNAHQDHSIWLDTDEEFIWNVLDSLNRRDSLALAQFIAIDLVLA